MTRSSPKSTVPPSWPVIAALAVVAVLVVAMFCVEYFITDRVARQVDALVANTQTSIVLLDDMRSKAQNLSEPGTTDTETARLSVAIITDARLYDPLATSPGEREAWQHLRDLLARLEASSPAAREVRDSVANDIDASVDRLIEINAREGAAHADVVHAAHRRLLRSDAVVGGLTLGLAAVIAFFLVRTLARQRRLISDRFELLDERTRDLEAFAGRAAHDLRSPMNPIRGYADLILESIDSPDDVAMMARRIRTAVDRMARVVDDMLALSTAGRPTPGSAVPDDVVLAVLEEMGPELHGVEVATVLSSGPVACSAGVLHQILRNLIGNALKFRARHRPLRISIETREVAGTVVVVVEDTGLGMDAETAEHALEPMYRGRSDREVPGHGLGLAIVDRTARALGGRCELTSQLDLGTKITVHLPRA
ncbi:MAG: HAMP domain-containing sensor histidine kinase [Kofleriaceae bacterium]